jgi:flagellar biosynthetic protein FliQ
MNEAQVLDIARDGVWTMLIVVGPILLIAMAIGLTISLFQTLTSMQEMTLTFVPKILVVYGSIILLLPFMIEHLTQFTYRMMDIIIALP